MCCYADWRSDVQSCLRLAQMLILYQEVLETPSGKCFMQCLSSIENRNSAGARFHFAQMLKAMWPTASSWREYVKLRVWFVSLVAYFRSVRGWRVLSCLSIAQKLHMHMRNI
jgi:hypothetical protein